MINWISIKDRLPPKGLNVLLKCSGYKLPFVVGQLAGGHSKYTLLFCAVHVVNHDYDEWLTDVTHWAEINMPSE